MSCGCGCGGEVVAYEDWEEIDVEAAEYQGRKVTLNKPFRTKGANKKFGVYTKNEKGNVVLVRFGDPNMEIKRDDPARRKSFRSRHNCDSPGPKWKARYWSCRQWRGGKKVEAEDGSPCGCGCNEDESVEAKDADDPCTEGYEQYGMKTKNGRRVPNCIPIKQKAEAGYDVCASCTSQTYCADHKTCKMESKEAAEPTPKDDESHEEYMSRCMAMGYSEDECMAAHEGHEFKVEGYKKKDEYASQTCGIGEELIDGECRKVAVTLELEIGEAEAILEATTGKTVIEIRGIAFHEGMNKNKWSLTKEGARFVAEQMVDSDLTLNHPKATAGGGFSRNMKGDIDEAIVGYITEATFEEREEGYIVRYAAHVVRTELFEALESGLWLRAGYGVSIGGSGVPVKADDDGLVFGEDFTFDHLAIVHKPAYNEANIESVKRVEAQTTIKYHSASEGNQQSVKIMTDEIIEDTNEMEALASQIEDLKAQVVLANSRVAEFEAADEARAEEERQVLVTEASEMGMKGHDDLSTETLRGLIASWVEAHPTPEPVEMKPVEEAVASETVVEASAPAPKSVVANYLNGTLIESDEEIYEKAWNAWASAWNNTLARNEKDDMRAAKYSEIKEMI